ncbi:hypothetical protein BGZ58_003016, partial [Dissophora ornata]
RTSSYASQHNDKQSPHSVLPYRRRVNPVLQQVRIESNKAVDELKKAIKAEKAVSFSDVDADMLTLWRVAIPVSDDDDDDEVPVYIDNIPKDDKKKLKATTKLSKVYDAELPEDTIHIIVQRPPPGNAAA